MKSKKNNKHKRNIETDECKEEEKTEESEGNQN